MTHLIGILIGFTNY